MRDSNPRPTACKADALATAPIARRRTANMPAFTPPASGIREGHDFAGVAQRGGNQRDSHQPMRPLSRPNHTEAKPTESTRRSSGDTLSPISWRLKARLRFHALPC